MAQWGPTLSWRTQNGKEGSQEGQEAEGNQDAGGQTAQLLSEPAALVCNTKTSGRAAGNGSPSLLSGKASTPCPSGFLPKSNGGSPRMAPHRKSAPSVARP